MLRISLLLALRLVRGRAHREAARRHHHHLRAIGAILEALARPRLDAGPRRSTAPPNHEQTVARKPRPRLQAPAFGGAMTATCSILRHKRGLRLAVTVSLFCGFPASGRCPEDQATTRTQTRFRMRLYRSSARRCAGLPACRRAGCRPRIAYGRLRRPRSSFNSLISAQACAASLIGGCGAAVRRLQPQAPPTRRPETESPGRSPAH